MQVNESENSLQIDRFPCLIHNGELTENFGDSLADPGLDHGEVHIFQVHFLQQVVGELQLLQELLVFVGKSIVLLCGGAPEESGICHPKFGRSRRSSLFKFLTRSPLVSFQMFKLK